MKTSTFSICSLIVGVSVAHAESLAFKFPDPSDTPIPSATTAGAGFYAQPNWNLLRTDWSANGENNAVPDATINPHERLPRRRTG